MSQVQTPQIYIPTGYEGLQRRAESKRKLAEALLSQGLQGPANPVSYAQVLGQLAQTWAGKRLGKQADTMQGGIDDRIKADWDAKVTEFNNDVATGYTPDQLVAKWRHDPMVQEMLKPYASTMEAGMKDAREFTNFGGKWIRKGDIPEGTFEPGRPTDKVIRTPDGNLIINQAAVTAERAGQGFDITGHPGFDTQGHPVALPWPGSAPAQSQVPAPSGLEISAQAFKGAAQSLGPQAFQAWVQRNNPVVKVQTPEEAQSLPSGTRLLLPDGSEGVVP